MSLRPRIRMPLWAAPTIVGAAYVARSIVVRGGDFRLDLPDDAIVALALLLTVTLVGFARRTSSNESADEVEEKHCEYGHTPAEERESHEL